jgi:hypothetical protein
MSDFHEGQRVRLQGFGPRPGAVTDAVTGTVCGVDEGKQLVLVELDSPFVGETILVPWSRVVQTRDATPPQEVDDLDSLSDAERSRLEFLRWRVQNRRIPG